MAYGRNVKNLAELNIAEADEMWAAIIEESLHGTASGIPFNSYGGTITLDNLDEILAFLGCVSGCKASCYANDMVKWMHDGGKGDNSTYFTGEAPTYNGANDAAAIVVQHCKSNAMTMPQKQAQGYLTTKQRKQINQKILRVRGSNQDSMIERRGLQQQLSQHSVIMNMDLLSTQAGVGIRSFSKLSEDSIMCKPPTSIGQFPKSRKYYAACMAMLCASTTQNTIVHV